MRALRVGLIGAAFAAVSLTSASAHAGQDKGYLGVGLKPVEKGESDSHNLLSTQGEVVSSVERGGPADRVGIKQGDIVVQVGGRQVNSSSNTARLVADLPPGARVAILIARGNQSFTVTPKLGRRPSDGQIASSDGRETPETRARSFIDDARATIAADNVRLKDRSIACDSTDAGEGGLKIARVDGLMQGLINIRPRSPDYMQAGVSRAIADLGSEAGRLRLEQADGLLAAGCNPQADRLYRFVLSNFSAPVFGGLRQRAQVGIEDVRTRGR